MAVRGVDHDEIDAGIDQPLGALEAAIADRGGGGAIRSRTAGSGAILASTEDR